MEGSDAAESKEDRAENKPHTQDRTSEDSAGPSTEDTQYRVGVFCCQDCGEAFREEATFLEHRHQHPQENTYLYTQLDNLRDAGKDSKTPNICSLCSVSFIDLSDLHLHMEKNHNQVSPKESGFQIHSAVAKQHTYECQDCGKSYGVIGHFLNHRRSHRQPSKSVFHDLQHLKKKSFQCESCGRSYSRASALDAHRRCHEEKLIKSRNRSSGDAVQAGESVVETKSNENQAEDYSEKVFTCSCGKAFSALLRLKTHQRFSRNSQCSPEEMKQKPKKSSTEFYCSECQKSFNGHIALFNHQRWHANHSEDSAKRFPCEECGKVFMTLTFYYRHQRTAHSDETPAKSFHHQLCQLQKKAFECKDCGLKFSRASALHSHQLHHTDVFRETEKEAQMCSSLPQDQMLESDRKETEHVETSTEVKVQSESLLPTSVNEELYAHETDDDMESYEPGDFNVQVISASESEDEPAQDLNPDLELLCESDQEGRDDGDIVSKPEMDLKIVQIDFEQADEPGVLIAREAENKSAEERFECPECYRWFSSPSSLRVHRMWHGVHKRRQQTQDKECSVECKDCRLKFTQQDLYKTHVHQHALEDKDPAAELVSERGEVGGKGDKDTGGDAATTKTKFENLYNCSTCGKNYKYLVSFTKHQQRHRETSSTPNIKNTEMQARLRREVNVEKCDSQRKGRDAKSRYQDSSVMSDCGEPVHHSKTSNLPVLADPSEELKSDDVQSQTGQELDENKEYSVECKDCGLKFTQQDLYKTHVHQHVLEEEDPGAELVSGRELGEEGDEDTSGDAASMKNTLQKGYVCLVCGKNYKYLNFFKKHQRRHRKRSSTASKINTDMQELLRRGGNEEKSDSRSTGRDAKPRYHDSSVESDCGESVLHSKISKLHVSADPPEELKSENVQSTRQTGGELHENKQHNIECKDCGLKFTQWELYKAHLHQHAVEEEEAPMGNRVTGELDPERIGVEENEDKDMNGHAAGCDMSNSDQTKPDLIQNVSKTPVKNTPRQAHSCLVCGKSYKYLVSFKKHQWLHRKRSSKANTINTDMQELLRREENGEKNDGRSTGEDAKPRYYDSSVESDFGESVHHTKISRLVVSADPPEESKSEDAQSQPGREDETKQHSIECKDCGLKFAQLELYKAHLHQHALEEEEAQMEDHSTGEPVPGRARAGDTSVDVAGCVISDSAQTNSSDLIPDAGVSAAVNYTFPKAHACSVCGKIYTYLVSFKKHQKLHENKPSAEKPQTEQNLRNYECPDCGMSFIRRTRLIGHLRVHRSRRSFQSSPRRCDTCNKDFVSVGSWMAHIEQHKQNPFWCLSCAQGFRNEASLDEHLQTHSPMKNKYNTFHSSLSGEKPYQSTVFEKSFSNPGELISHQKLHPGVCPGTTSVEEEPKINTDMEEQLEKEENVEECKVQSPCDKFGDLENSDESDCGEPVHHYKHSGQPGSAELSQSKSEDVQSQTRQELDEAKSQETNIHREHKYWEWECFECDMGFDEVAKLHLHYIKHATGELPILWDDSEG